VVLAVYVRPRLACASSACAADWGGRLSPTQASAMQNRCFLAAFYALLMAAGRRTRTLRPVSPSVSSAWVLAGASRSRTLRRFAGDRGARQRCSALSQKLARKPSEPPRAPRCAASKLCTILPINFQARKPRLLPRPRQETQLFTSSRRRRQTDRAKPLGITRRPKVKSHNTMEEPGIEPAAKSGLRPRRRPSARASARRGTQPSLRNSHETRRPRTTTSRPPSRRTSRRDPRRDDSSSRPTTRCRRTGARKVVDT